MYISVNIHIYIYIYIVNHRQTVSLYHNSSVQLDKQDASSWDRNQPIRVIIMTSRTYIDVYFSFYNRGIIL